MAAQGMIAVITGAGSGIGRAVALAFLADGFRVVGEGAKHGGGSPRSSLSPG